MASNLLLRVLLLQCLSFSIADQQHVLKGKINPLDAKFAKLALEKLEEWKVPGLAIGVVDGDDMWSEGYGIATFPSTPVTPSTLFYGASTSKAFTAAAMSLLVTSGNYTDLTWTTPVTSIIPADFVLENEYATKHVSIEDILSHRTGMPRHDFSYGGDYDGRPGTIKDVVRALRYLPMTEQPRTRWQYCNMMFMTASYVIETLSGYWLGDFLKEKIWTPLGMHSTYFSNSSAHAAPEHFARGYVHFNDSFLPAPWEDLDIVSGAGSVISNVQDYSKWIHAMLHHSPPIPKDAYKAILTPRMLQPHKEPYTGALSYALGWDTSTYRGYEFFEHSGGMTAMGSQVIFFPALGYGLCAFGNTALTSNAAELTLIWRLIDDKLGVPEEERYDITTKLRSVIKQRLTDNANATSIYYPSLPSPRLPPSLALSAYTGTFFQPAYRNLTVFEANGTLHVSRPRVGYNIEMDLEHVSGEYFIAHLDSPDTPGLTFLYSVAAEFRVGSDGVVGSLGLAVEEEMGVQGRIWFERV